MTDAAQDNSQNSQRKKRRKWPWIMLLIVVLVPLFALGWSGIWNIPVLTSLFGSDTPIDLGIHPTAQDLKNGEKKILVFDVTGEDAALNDLTVNKTFKGQKPVDHTVSSEELTAVASKYLPPNSPITNLQLKITDGGMEASMHVNPYINAPVYFNGGIAKASDSSVDINLTNVKIGRLSIPSNWVADIEVFAGELINDRMRTNSGFTIETLRFTNDGIVFKGTYPEEVEVTSGRWLDY